MCKSEEDYAYPCTIEFKGATYKHDCSNCEFLGVIQADYGVGLKPLDVYICKRKTRNEISLIARYSGDGPDYYSSPFTPTCLLRYGEDYKRMIREGSQYPLAVAYLVYQDEITEALNVPFRQQPEPGVLRVSKDDCWALNSSLALVLKKRSDSLDSDDIVKLEKLRDRLFRCSWRID
jgi:hypothetical protein